MKIEKGCFGLNFKRDSAEDQNQMTELRKTRGPNILTARLKAFIWGLFRTS